MKPRKLQSIGGASLSLILPKEWVKARQLEKSSTVYAHTLPTGDLLIQAREQAVALERMVYDIDGSSPAHVEREIVSRYIAGADEILLKGHSISPALRQRIRTFSQSLMGLEIIDESGTEMLIKNIFDPKTLPITQTVDTLFGVTDSMFRDAFAALRTDDKKLAQDVIDRDQEVNKLQLAITRQYYSLLSGKAVGGDLAITLHKLDYYEKVAVQIERIADHASKVADAVLSSNRPLKRKLAAPETARTAEKVLSLLQEASAMVSRQDGAVAHSILDRSAQIEKEIARMGDAVHHETHRGMILEIALDRMRGYIMNIAEMTIDYIVQEQ
ncbi:hypothetical protein FJY93_01690 [Candidatus Kaiserbacteria bacterium]|nr:hypothetical protein [Candidatus Kaiserbacteria bacterium]